MYFNVIDFVVFYTKSHDIALSSVHHIDNAEGYVFEKYILWKLRLRLYFLFMSQPFFIYTLGCRLVHKGWRSKSGGGKWCVLIVHNNKFTTVFTVYTRSWTKITLPVGCGELWTQKILFVASLLQFHSKIMYRWFTKLP